MPDGGQRIGPAKSRLVLRVVLGEEMKNWRKQAMDLVKVRGMEVGVVLETTEGMGRLNGEMELNGQYDEVEVKKQVY